MWIATIELINFKSYSTQKFTFPEPVAGKNLVLVGGMNGYGKTTLLESLYLCLYGKDAMPYLARAGLNLEKGYPTFLERAFNGRALESSRTNMSVKVEILSCANPREGYSIWRQWFFNNNGKWNEEEIRLMRISPGAFGQTMDEKRLPEILGNHFVPAHIAPFFFFDGEEVKKLADQSRIEQIRTGMEGLLGVVLLRELQQRLTQYQTATRQKGSVKEVNEKKYQELEGKIDRDESALKKLKKQQEELVLALEADKTHRDDLMGRIMALGGGGGDLASAKEIIEEQQEKKNELAECASKMEAALANKLPFHFVHRNFTGILKKQLRQEIARRRWDARREGMAPDKERFVASFFAATEPVITPPLADGQEETVRARLDASWESLFYPMPSDCAETIVHDYLVDERRETLLTRLDELAIGAADIRGLLDRKESVEKRLDELGKRLAKIEGVDRDGTLADLNRQLQEMNAVIDGKQKELGSLERQIRSFAASIDQDKATWQRMHDMIIQAAPGQSNIAKAERVHQLIEKLIPKLYVLKTRQLGDEMTSAYKQLAHKQQNIRIEIGETGQSRLVAGDGAEINLDRSAGENQLFATALLAGLAEISGVNAPLVVDTPLARLDSVHRRNILKFWISRQDRQVILLSQDAEIDAGLFTEFQASVGKTWLLEHNELGRGIGQTIARENQYFQEVRNNG